MLKTMKWRSIFKYIPLHRLLCGILILLMSSLYIIWTRLDDPVSIDSMIRSLPEYPSHYLDRQRYLRQCTSNESESQGKLFAALTPTWPICYSDIYLTAFNAEKQQTYTMIDVGSNKGYAMATWFAFFSPKLNINQLNLHKYLQSTDKVNYPCGSCNDCQDPSLTRSDTREDLILHVHAFEPQPATTDLLKGVQTWMNVTVRSASTFDVYGAAVSK
jgi:hypothetical protein